MSKKKKRLERMRRNRNNVSFEDFILVLEDYGFQMRGGGKESHRIAKLTLENETFVITFVKPHGKQKFMHAEAIKELLEILAIIDISKPDTDEEDEANDE